VGFVELADAGSQAGESFGGAICSHMPEADGEMGFVSPFGARKGAVCKATDERLDLKLVEHDFKTAEAGESSFLAGTKPGLEEAQVDRHLAMLQEQVCSRLFQWHDERIREAECS
jgi:hypothetical protein